MIASFTATSDTARSAVTDVAQDLRRLATNLEATSDVARGFLTDGQQLVRDVDAKVDPLASSLIGTLDKAQGTLANLDGVLTGRDCLALLEGIEVVSRQLPAVQHDLISALDGLAGPAELGGTARSGRRPRPSCGCTTTGRSA